ncbi:hypothetical protein MSG28_015085 [Choristoneura fumiferana]|uniref:Uncharacterized protein n=1 Tax=Choristoneura fumiferana TaxID=7141 RepID=A0ACC0KZG4_CHOFU|nr:hypothetical protein MSG28_015085 [Choristoneura fumiferana]
MLHYVIKNVIESNASWRLAASVQEVISNCPETNCTELIDLFHGAPQHSVFSPSHPSAASDPLKRDRTTRTSSFVLVALLVRVHCAGARGCRYIHPSHAPRAVSAAHTIVQQAATLTAQTNKTQ